MNESVEFHDSVLAGVTVSGSSATVRLDPAYVHRWEGGPGTYRGTGWSRTVEIRFREATVETRPTGIPCHLYDGSLTLNGRVFDDLVPCPAEIDGIIGFEAVTTASERLVVRGIGVSVVPVGEATYVEELPADFRIP